jgi:hypothetical protein
MKTRNIFYFLFALISFSACEKIVEVEFPSDEPKLVIESQITNKKDLWKVRLTLSQPYFDQDSADNISSALVNISATDGSSIDLVYSDTGMFVSTDSMQCVIGETYTLTVKYNGQTYTAAEELANGFPIDLMLSFYLPSTNGFVESGYYIFIQGKENDYKGDSYLWKFYKNDTLQETFNILAENDEFGPVSYLNASIDPKYPLKGLAQNILPRPFPFLVEPGDTVRLEQYNLSPTYLQFLFDVQSQLGRSGTPFDPPPANPNNNISNGGLGYFSVAHYTTKEIIVEE